MVERLPLVERLAALAHDARLGVFTLLVRAGRPGLPAGEIGERLSIPANALSFHLNRLRQAGLVIRRRQGRQVIYAADFAAMRTLVSFLADNCCAEDPAGCSTECPTAPTRDAASPPRRRSA